MNINWMEWAQLILRWAHVFAGILWIGSTYFFTWLDGRLTQEERAAREGQPAQVWMVHSGGFYVVEKQKTLSLLDRKLHWFRWEAAFTWLSGVVLLVMVYYMGGLMVDSDVADISPARAAALGVGLLVIGWAVYDALWQSPIGRSEVLGVGVSSVLLCAAVYGSAQIFSGRAAYMHIGAMLGTIMTANVWMRILPAQRKMIAAVKESGAADMALAARAKQRSRHNTFMVMPVVFTMISSHYPGTYGSAMNWAILMALIILGWVAAAFLRRA